MCWLFNGVSSEQFQRWSNVQTLSKLWPQRFLQKVGKILVVEVSRALNRSIWHHIICSSTFPTSTNLFSHPPVVRTVLCTVHCAQVASDIMHDDSSCTLKLAMMPKKDFVGRSRKIQSCTDGKSALNRSLWLHICSSLVSIADFFTLQHTLFVSRMNAVEQLGLALSTSFESKTTVLNGRCLLQDERFYLLEMDHGFS